MKYKILVFLFNIISISCFSQFHREVNIRPINDTTSVDFHRIYETWENYLNDLNNLNMQQNYLLQDFDTSLEKYWLKSEIDSYRFVDLYYSFCSGYGQVFETRFKENFIGIVKRDSTTFELKTMFTPNIINKSEVFPSLMITVPVKKVGNSYKLYNAFTHNKSILQTTKFENIIYYYPLDYHFNDSLAKVLSERIKLFKKDFSNQNIDPIIYLLADNLTEIIRWFGIDYYEGDYLGIYKPIEGRAISNNNMLLSAGGGENYMHEIIHLLLKEYKQQRGSYNYFEEGIACFWGEHIGRDYSSQSKRLKTYLNKNEWIDLSKSLDGYYFNEQNKHIYFGSGISDGYDFNNYRDAETNYTYIIHAVLCEIAFKKGGIEKVKAILLHKTENENEFYAVIENELGINRQNIDKFIRDYLNQNYAN